MTDVLAALAVLADADHPARAEALAAFYAALAGRRSRHRQMVRAAGDVAPAAARSRGSRR